MADRWRRLNHHAQDRRLATLAEPTGAKFRLTSPLDPSRPLPLKINRSGYFHTVFDGTRIESGPLNRAISGRHGNTVPVLAIAQAAVAPDLNVLVASVGCAAKVSVIVVSAKRIPSAYQVGQLSKSERGTFARRRGQQS